MSVLLYNRVRASGLKARYEFGVRAPAAEGEGESVDERGRVGKLVTPGDGLSGGERSCSAW